MRNIHAIILAGGTGSRMGGNLPKQFLALAEKPLILYSLQRFRNWGLCKSINIVCHKEWVSLMEETVSPLLEGIDQIIEGGATRHESTLRALAQISWDEEDILFIHDAARPYFLETELDELVGVTQIFGAGTLALKATETVVRSKIQSGFTEVSIPREEVYFVKTPQSVSGKMLKKLLSTGGISPNEHPTDLCSWVETIGEKTGIVLSTTKNIKVTTSDDMKVAESYLLP
jgi:2-C-methyl-D-erythritol 4-phosphate cytidylyltransferase